MFEVVFIPPEGATEPHIFLNTVDGRKQYGVYVQLCMHACVC